MKFTKSMKQRMREERSHIFDEMSKEGISQDAWHDLNKRYQTYNEMLKKSPPRISLDTLLIVAGNLAGILLILKFEKLDIITTKALGFILKGRV